MSEGDHAEAVNNALDLIRAGELIKVVFAARKTGRATCAIDAAALLRAVTVSNSKDEGKRYTFLFAPNGLNDEVRVTVIFSFYLSLCSSFSAIRHIDKLIFFCNCL